MKSSTSTILAALLVAVVLATPTAAASSRRMLLGTCEDDCSKTYEDNVKKCIADTKLGEPPAIAKADAGKADMFVDYVPPTDTGFQLAEKECRRLQDPELQKCKAACNKKDCNAIVKKCNDAFNEGSMLAAWCSKKEGC